MYGVKDERRVGQTQVSVTQLGFGSAYIGEYHEKVPDAQARATLEAAWQAGVRYFDTSPFYGEGLAEHRVGEFLRDMPRNEFVVSTKVGRLLRSPVDPARPNRGPCAGGLPFEHHFDYSYAGVMRSFEDSLQRLGLDRVEMLIIHDLDAGNLGCETGVSARMAQLINGGWLALSDLKGRGAIGAIGAGINDSTYATGMIPRFLELFDLDFFLMAGDYTLLDTDILDTDFALCAERGVGLVIGTVFASGILATGAVPGAQYLYEDAKADVLAKVASIEEVCGRHGVSLPAAALQFALAHPLVAAVIPGAIAPEQVIRNAAVVQEPIPPAFWEDLKSEGLLRSDAPVPA